MADNELHFPDIDEYVWAIDVSDDGSRWWAWGADRDLPDGGFATTPDNDDIFAPISETLRAQLVTALDGWLIVAAGTETDFDECDLWVRVSAWRLGRIVDGGVVHTMPAETDSPAVYGRWLYASKINPDAVEVRTPFQVVRLTDEKRRSSTNRP